jgi:hypothetical protein
MNDYRIYSQCGAVFRKARASRRRIPEFRHKYGDLNEAIGVANKLANINSNQYCVLDFSPGKRGRIVFTAE